jgi:antitoxin PrlF
MAQFQTKLTSQSQVSVPAPIRNAMGLKPGSVIEWSIQGDQIIVTRVVRWSTQDIHKVLFDDKPKLPKQERSLAELKQGIKEHVRKHHARD